MKHMIKSFFADETGAITVEKMVVIGGVVGLVIASVGAITSRTERLTGKARTELILSQINVENGRFDVDGIKPNTVNYLRELDGWTSKTGWFEVWGNGFLGVESDGGSFIELDHTPGAMDSISTTMDIPDGEELYLVFDATARTTNSASERFGIRVNGEVVATITPDTVKDFQTYTVPVTGGPGQDTIEIFEYSSDGMGVLLDNVYVATAG